MKVAGETEKERTKREIKEALVVTVAEILASVVATIPAVTQ